MSSCHILHLGILGGTVTATGMGQCREDQFFVTNPGGPSPPVICGIMTGEHSRLFQNILPPI